MKAKLTYTGIRANDLEKSIAFYTKVLGMKVKGRSRIEQNKGEVVSLTSEEGGPEVELNYYEKGSRFASEYVVGEGLDHLAFQVEDLDRFLAEAKKAGFPPVLEIKGQSSKWAYIEDPNGIYIELFA
jgi:lactoylglutathione lyase